MTEIKSKINGEVVSCIGNDKQSDTYFDRVLRVYNSCKKVGIPVCIKRQCPHKNYIHLHIYKKDYDFIKQKLK